MEFRISVIVSTYNGSHKLIKLLAALANSWSESYELIIMVDGSTDDTMKVLKDHTSSFRNVKICYQENGGRSVVRNNGANMASGNLLIFFDDDMRPESHCIQEHIQHHKKFPNSLLSGAQIDDVNASDKVFQKYKSYLSNKWATPLLSLQGSSLPADKLHLTAANLSIAKELFSQLGGFDERLRDAEDFDLAIRAMKAGLAVYYNHAAFAWHDDFVTIKSYIARLRQYKKAHHTLRTLKAELYRDIILREETRLPGWQTAIYRVFVNKHLLNSIENDNFLIKLLPAKLKYRLFDIITTAYGVHFVNEPLN